MKVKKVFILVDNPRSWFINFAEILKNKIKKKNISCKLVTNAKKLNKKADLCFYLSCTKITRNKTLNQFKKNIVVHGSNLPIGRGHAPWIWKILSGSNKINLSLFEIDPSNSKPDSGPIYFRKKIQLKGTELLDDIRLILAKNIINMCVKFIEHVRKKKNFKPKKQTGKGTFYRMRKPEDQELNLKKNIISQFNLFRTADNNRWPVFFKYKKIKYILKVYNS